MDLVLADLAGEYAIETEAATALVLETAATLQTPAVTAASDAAAVTAAVWKAVGASAAAMRGTGRPVLAVAPDMMGAIGPLFSPLLGPVNGQVTGGFQATGLATQGDQGSISGVTVVMSTALSAGTVLLVNTTAAEVYEQRIGSLQVTEPSVLGVQVAYAGYFQAIVLVPTAIISLTA